MCTPTIDECSNSPDPSENQLDSRQIFAHLVHHYETCLERFGDCPRGVDWPDRSSAQARYRVMAELLQGQSSASLLDFGCGAGHFLDFLRATNRQGVRYMGLDLSPAFISLCRSKYKGISFRCGDILANEDIVPEVDFVVMNGVFTERQGIDWQAMYDAMCELLRVVYSKTRQAMAFNLMSKLVDWERADLFHVPYELIAEFVHTELSPHHVIRADYGLREYTVYVYRNCQGQSQWVSS
jgi:SAM-dependent methyltransferase